MYLSCLSTVSVKWSTFASSVRIACMISTRVPCVGVEGDQGHETCPLARASSLVQRYGLPERHGAIHPPKFFVEVYWVSRPKIIVKTFDILLLFNYSFYCTPGKQFHEFQIILASCS